MRQKRATPGRGPRGSLGEIRARVVARDAEILTMVVERGLPVGRVAKSLDVSAETVRLTLVRHGCRPYRVAGQGRGWDHPDVSPVEEEAPREASLGLPAGVALAALPRSPEPPPGPQAPRAPEPLCCRASQILLAGHLGEMARALVAGLEQQLTAVLAQRDVAQAQVAERGQRRSRASGAARLAAAEAARALVEARRKAAMELAAARAQGRRLVLQVEARLRLEQEVCTELRERLLALETQQRLLREEREKEAARQPDRARQVQLPPRLNGVTHSLRTRPRLPVGPAPPVASW